MMLELAKVRADVNGILRTLLEFLSAQSKWAHFLLLVMVWVLLKARLEPTHEEIAAPGRRHLMTA